jgi:hypothetical protein
MQSVLDRRDSRLRRVGRDTGTAGARVPEPATGMPATVRARAPAEPAAAAVAAAATLLPNGDPPPLMLWGDED